MVFLNRIYTKGGDKGETSLGDGARVPKTAARIIAYGGTDELNAVLGVAVVADADEETARVLKMVQNDLFDAGADLCVPLTEPQTNDGTDKTRAEESRQSQPLRMTPAHVEGLERVIDAVNERLQPLESFVLPGGSPAAAYLHHARTVCRRVEIDVWKLAEKEPVNPQLLIYLNRLSDLLFVLARAANDDGKTDILWVPGQSGQPDKNS